MHKTLLKSIAPLLLPLSGYAAASGQLRASAYQRSVPTPASSVSALQLALAPSGAFPPVVRHHPDPAQPGVLASPPVATTGLQLQSGQLINELLIIDAAVPDKSLFYRQAKPGVDIAEINSEQDGLQQLTAILAQYQNLDALHILSHAEAGTVLLGNSRITAETVKQHIELTDGINQALKDGADLLFYGCNLAANEQGEELLNIIAGQANVDVAASDDLTGASLQGGDWELELATGDIEADVPFSNKALIDFGDVLAINDASGATITQDAFSPNSSTVMSLSATVADGFVAKISGNVPSYIYCVKGYYCYFNENGLANDLNKIYFEFEG